MRNNLPKVLMLGWEFPPLINGGLGVACHDLSEAMSEFAEITMIIPRSSPGFKMRHMNLIGINNVDLKSLENFPSNYRRSFPFKIYDLPADLNPYYTEEKFGEGYSDNFSDGRRILDSFNAGSLYGGNVINKVLNYAEIAASLASKMDFDVIHAHDWMTMPAAIRIKELSGKPMVCHIHSLEIDRSGSSEGWVYEMEKYGMQFADLLMPVSNFTAANITRFYGPFSGKISVVHNGSPKINYLPVKKSYDEKTVLFVGRITRQKGPEIFVDIAGKVLEKNPKTRFVMAGVGDNFRSIVEKSSCKGLGNRLHLTGFLNQAKLSGLFSHTDVYCMPSVSEPFGLSAVEAAQCGIPCVISRQSGVSEVLSGALKFDFWDVDKAAGYILNLLGDKILKDKVVEDAYRNLQRVSWSASASKIIEAYTRNHFI